jgi:hypothetical protein
MSEKSPNSDWAPGGLRGRVFEACGPDHTDICRSASASVNHSSTTSALHNPLLAASAGRPSPKTKEIARPGLAKSVTCGVRFPLALPCFHRLTGGGQARASTRVQSAGYPQAPTSGSFFPRPYLDAGTSRWRNATSAATSTCRRRPRASASSSLEASIIAEHSDLRTTQEYTVVPLKRQEELTRHVQRKHGGKVVEIKKKETAA